MSSLRPSPKASLYANLRIHGRQIRLLEIVSTEPLITCRLEVADLKDDLEYSALSYVWGDPNVTKTIIVNERQIPVTSNLECALQYAPQHLERANATPRLWVDAVCIDQDNVNEKNHQVPLMRDIYSQAKVVLCWMSPRRDDVVEALDVIDIIAEEREVRKADEEHSELELAASSLVRRQMECFETNANSLGSFSNLHAGLLYSPERIGSTSLSFTSLEGALRKIDSFLATLLSFPGLIRPTLEHCTAIIQHGIHGTIELLNVLKARAQLDVDSLDVLDASCSRIVNKLAELDRLTTAAQYASNVEWLFERFPEGTKMSLGWLMRRFPWVIESMFNLPYWGRVWIFQEVVLAKKPIFICGTRSTSLESLYSFRRWAEAITFLPLSEGTQLPRGPISDWAVLKQQCGISTHDLVFIFNARRDVGHASGLCLGRSELASTVAPSCNVWWVPRFLSASDPRDYFYGLLGVSRLELVSDYSPETSIGLLCRDFMVEYLKASLRQESPISMGGTLSLLAFAGIGHGWFSYPNTPSWAPNFPGIARGRVGNSVQGVPIQCPEYHHKELTPFKLCEEPKIVGADMLVEAVLLDTIVSCGPLQSDYADGEILHAQADAITWVIDFARRHQTYVAGGHPLAAVNSLLQGR